MIDSNNILGQNDLAGYHAGRNGAALRDESHHGRLWLSGSDRIDFLQRLTSNEVRLGTGQGTVTVLTSASARINVVFTLQIHEEGVLLIAGPGEGPRAYSHLSSQIFFNDQVNIEGRGSVMAQFGLYGPRATQVLAEAGVAQAADLAPFAWQPATVAGALIIVQRNEGLGSDGYILLAPAETAETIRDLLISVGATDLPEEAYDILRVESGVPAAGSELTDRVSPLEAGLRRFCDDHKGCYTGQEIIARQITYDKVTTHLMGLYPQKPVTIQSPILANGRKIGWVSSSVHSLGLDRPIALGFLRRPFDEENTQVIVDQTSGPVEAVVTTLPFLDA
ncbi:MAG: glycine cleavage T C-terminal barrel domain-containing protein [Chloroflexota bacterium]|nr:glycine cleavage T C-terminal barrel domain-containing protein [Chloroflexota bacterium]